MLTGPTLVQNNYRDKVKTSATQGKIEYGNKATIAKNQLFQLTKTTVPLFTLITRKDDEAASLLLNQPFNESRCAMKYGFL